MSINKSQRKMLFTSSPYLGEAWFSHGQLYVGSSRVEARQIYSLKLYPLKFNIGALVILLGNFKPPRLCNEIYLVVKKLLKHVTEAIILKGCGMGEDVFIPTITLVPSVAEIPFSLDRLQFPWSLCFVMSINYVVIKELRFFFKFTVCELVLPCSWDHTIVQSFWSLSTKRFFQFISVFKITDWSRVCSTTLNLCFL